MASPSNTEVIREVKILGGRMDQFDSRLIPLEQWKIAYDAASAAIDKYKKDQQLLVPAGKADGVNALNKDFLALVAKVVALLTSLTGIIYFLVQNIKPH